jgi:acyl-coenzyme A synthetase/AMP-(fatty) acid ligase
VAELRAFASTKLAPFKVPERWTFVAALPYTASGKIMKSVLRRELADLARVEGPDGAARPVAPSEQ